MNDLRLRGDFVEPREQGAETVEALRPALGENHRVLLAAVVNLSSGLRLRGGFYETR